MAVWGLLVGGAPLVAESVVDRIQARGVLTAGAVSRPGLAEQDDQGRWKGLDVDVCRAIASVVLHSPDKVEFHEYATDQDFVRGAQSDDVLFLSGSEMADHAIAGQLVPGPTVFLESQGVMVSGKSSIQHLSDLRGASVCFLIGTSTERGLNAFADATGVRFFRRAFSEDGEMEDAYAVQNCQAMAGEVTDLAEVRDDANVRYLDSRILPEPLATFPIVAATGTTDARWSALVAWTIDTLISADHPETPWTPGGASAMPVVAPELGLPDHWQATMLHAVGTYRDIFRRNLGADSPLKLPLGSLVSPYRD